MNTEIFDLGKIGITLGYEYDDKVIYEKLTIVLYKGKSYISTKTTKGVSPEQDIKTWQLVAEAKDAYNMLVDAGKTTLTKEEFLEQLVDATKGRYVIQGNLVNAADEEDLTVEHSDLLGIDTLKLANRPSTDGMGYIILRKNKSFAEQVTKENTIYEIRYDFTLTEDVTIPENCVLKFNGGSIKANSNYNKITGDFEIVSPTTKIFNSIELSEYTKPLHSKWFCYADGTHDDSVNLKNLFDSAENIIIDEGVHRFTSTVILSKYVQIYGNSPHNKYGDCCLYYDNTSGTAISMNLYDRIPYIKIKGIHLYGKHNPENYYEYYSGTIGIDVATDGLSPNLEVEDCYFENFEYVFNSNHKSYYNSFRRVRANSFDTFCYNFDANNFNVIECRIQYGKIAFKFLYQSGGDGPTNIDKCSIEQVEHVLVASKLIQKVNFTNNYVEITDLNIPLSKENGVIMGNIANVCSIGNELQVNSVFRLYYLDRCKCFVSIGNNINFSLSNTKVNDIYNMSTNIIEVFIAGDSFKEASESSISGANYRAFPGTNTNIQAPGNAIVQAIDPVSKKRFSWDGKFERSTIRPANVYNGYYYFDTTLNKPIWWNGSAWVDATGTTV